MPGDLAGLHLSYFAMMGAMLSPFSSSLRWCSAVALLFACSTTVDGGQGAEPDASIAQAFPDGAPVQDVADAAPVAQPCTDGDTQVTGPDGETCYMLFNTLTSWQAAQAACLGAGATLVIIDSDAEQNVVGGLSASFPVGAPDLWIGASDEALENSFVWVDGTAMVFDNWRDGEPNNNGTGGAPENCTVIEGDTVDHEWDDRSCIAPAPYICERPAP